MSEKPSVAEVFMFLFVVAVGFLFLGWGVHELKARRRFKKGWKELERELDSGEWP